MSRELSRKIHRGEVWIADLAPVRGAEMDKSRPVLIVSSDAMGVLPVKLAAPCTTSILPAAPWRVPLKASPTNGLDRDTTIDLMQLRAISTERLVKKLGVADADTMEDIAAMVAVIVEHE